MVLFKKSPMLMASMTAAATSSTKLHQNVEHSFEIAHMRLWLALPALAATELLSGCAPTMNITSEMRRQAASTPILTSEQVGGRKYTIITEVVGRSCARQAGSDPSMDAAREELKIKAAQVSADAVTSALCKEGGVDMTHNCWKSVECRGDAVKWAP